VGRFLDLLFFAARFRLVFFALRFFAMVIAPSSFQPAQNTANK
jgi:hypothetical protein